MKALSAIASFFALFRMAIGVIVRRAATEERRFQVVEGERFIVSVTANTFGA